MNKESSDYVKLCVYTHKRWTLERVAFNICGEIERFVIVPVTWLILAPFAAVIALAQAVGSITEVAATIVGWPSRTLHSALLKWGVAAGCRHLELCRREWNAKKKGETK